MDRNPQVSVVVCTRNRSRTLAQACTAFLGIDYPPERWELLIVDNGSTDDTLQVAHGIARSRPDLVRVIEEPRIGLSAARNTGVRHSRGDIIAFADDDAFPEPGWLHALVDVLMQENVLAAGGPVEPDFQGELPPWFSDCYLPYLAAWDKGAEIQPLTYNDYPRGNNCAFRREVFQRFGYFSPHLGRTGSSLLSCEEIELCLRIERGGRRILYAPGARIRHLTVTERITPEWLARRFAAQGHSEAIIDWQHAGWKGLRRGWPHFYRAARAARQNHLLPDGQIFARCWRQALVGYSLGLLRAPLTVPRYRPTGAASDWLPWT
ncbi:MAG TPA: glycosyltransferase [Thermoanaerobaculia bacterium]|nr:glycosyltransferase [Thermoanaerobaculia bacterium]